MSSGAVNPEPVDHRGSRDSGASPQQDILAAGSRITLAGQTHEVLVFERGASGRLDVVLDTGTRLRRVPFFQLLQQLSAEKPPVRRDAGALVHSPALAELPEERQRYYLERYHDLLQVQTGSLRGDLEGDRAAGIARADYDPDTTTLTQRLERKSAERLNRGAPASSVRSLRRDLRKIASHGIEGLIHANTKSSHRVIADCDDKVVQVVREVVLSQKDAAKVTNAAMLRKARAALIRAGICEGVSDYRLRRLIAEVSRAEDLHLEAKSRERAALKPGTVYGARLVSRPGEVVQVDATTTNLHVYDARLGWVRAMILSAIDVYTRSVLALRVVTGTPTSRDVAMLVWDMGRPYVTRAGFPYELAYHHGVPRLLSINANPDDVEAGELERIGIKPALAPSVIVMDHGKEFDSAHLMSALARIGVDVEFCAPRTPHAKGVVEAFHNAIREIQALLPAYKGADVNNHPAGVEDLATLTAQDLRDALWEYVLEIYHHTPHRGLTAAHRSDTPLSPAMVWSAYLGAGGSVCTPSDRCSPRASRLRPRPCSCTTTAGTSAGSTCDTRRRASGCASPAPVKRRGPANPAASSSTAPSARTSPRPTCVP